MLGSRFDRGPRRPPGDDAVRERLARLAGSPDLRPPGDPRAAADTGPGRHAARPVGPGTRWRAAVSDLIPARLHGALDGGFSGHHLGVLAVLLAVGLAVTAWWVLSGRPEPEPVRPASFGSAPEPAPSGATPDPGASSPVADASGSDATPTDAVRTDAGTVVVDVAGRVRHPGIVTLPAGSRVADAIEAAGGARPGVDLAGLNLARVLVDGEQILVGVAPVAAPVPTDPSATAPAAGVVNINTADLALLETLPGIGPVTAQAILDWRAENGAFTSVDELIEVDGIGEVTLEEIRDLVTV